MSKFIKVCEVDKLADGGMRTVIADGIQIVVARDQGTFYALKDECSHEEFPLSEGWIEDGCMFCAFHGAKFDLKKATNGQFYFNLKAGNGEVILTSEMYNSKAAAENGIESVKKNAGDEGHFEQKESKSGKSYFVLKAANHQVIGQSQQYSSASSCSNGIASVMKNGPTADTNDMTAG